MAAGMLMPNPHNDQAYEIQDLSEYIGSSTVHFEEGDFEVLVEDGFDVSDTPAAEDYGIVSEKELFKNDKEGEGN